jgi:aromatic ring-opening dioxygenase LigB subunit
MSICASALMCHAPIVIPAVAGARADACAASTTAMQAAGRFLAESRPELLVCLSPHTPRLRRQFGVVRGGPVGDLKRFGAPDVAIDLPGDADAEALLLQEAGALAAPIAPDALDHGAAVPLWFLQQAGFAGPTVLIALPWSLDDLDKLAFGQAIARAAARSGSRWAVLASGDMSHCLKPGAPSGFHEDGARFDAAFISALRSDDVTGGLLALSALRQHAAEDAVDTTLIACGAADLKKTKAVLSYEGPFGVGYGIALLS